MARVTMVKQAITRNGLNAIYAGPQDGVDVAASPSVFLHVKNASGASIDVTLTTHTSVDGIAVPDKVIAVPAGEDRFIGPLAPPHYSGPDGYANVNFSSNVSVTVAALDVSQ